MFERLQSQAMREVIGERYVLAAIARGVPRSRILRRGALKAALRPVTSVYGLVVAALLSGSFAVEMVTSWPGLGRLMLDALRARDVFLVAGCAAAGAVFLACGTLCRMPRWPSSIPVRASRHRAGRSWSSCWPARPARRFSRRMTDDTPFPDLLKAPPTLPHVDRRRPRSGAIHPSVEDREPAGAAVRAGHHGQSSR